MKNTHTNRIEVIDALRGFAIVAILLLHNIEHFDLYFLPEQLPEWMKVTDRKMWDVLFFIFAGKAYSIFAILFGFTFYLQQTKQKEKGKDFSGRFAWRLLLLFGFGIINTALYVGDILLFYAILGFILIPVRNLKLGYILAIILFFFLQPEEWFRLICEWKNYPVVSWHELYGPYFQSLHETMKDTSFFHMVAGNFKGKPGHLLWFWSAGRVTQTAGLFLLGFLLGRWKVFYDNPENTRLWKKVLLLSTALFIPFYFINYGIFNHITGLWSNLFFTFMLISSFILLYKSVATKVLAIFIPLGRMSLSSYMMQSVIGSFIYYGYGLALYQYTGATLSVLTGLIFCTFQWFFCKWWLSKHRQGPLEKVWHTLTWI